MQNLISLWSQMNLRRRVTLIGVTLAVFLLVFAMSQIAGRTEYALLYSGLEPQAAGEIVAALEQRGIAYEVRGNAIQVDAARRDTIRMTLAAEGLPAAGGAGYELLDGMSGFGTTSQMFDAAYWRAKEGELARTILANPAIRNARVHIAQSAAQPFRKSAPPTASVTVTTASGTVSAEQAKALRHLVAAAVSGMRPEDVAVIDSVGGLVPPDSDPATNAAASDRETALRQNIERLLEARVGPGNAVVELSLDLVTDQEQITEHKFDPQGRVAISTDTTEKSGTNREANQDVTVASNLPEGNAGQNGGSQSQSSETRERVNFEVSETRRELVRGPGTIRRLTIAVLVNGLPSLGQDGSTSWQPRPETELADLRELVASASGLDTSRGDVLTLKSLSFESFAPQGTLAEASWLPPLDVMRLVQIGALALVTLVLGIFVLRPLLTGARQIPDSDTPLLPATGTGILPVPAGMTESPRVVSGEIDDIGDISGFADIPGESVDLPDDPVDRLRRLIEARQAESVQILRGWLEEPEERAS
ncbi:flagellar M-ring protein FliF [Gemmobacter caeni]|uniref:Flagellar M-ring protein n=1 Tax=Gemmobacter caeni TaxID=589035 RepID=A0A2T6AQQ0_9RHOB|nr:flagellar basal-body MS-ring/collar protein FliF [Gemmobacter caeni]PTX46132.1 flagellar M-ring protein FliF [Gemmobacter caeni]TWI94502.1 flagellar M-ring protein FliF [Gemmobacter caeni]